MDRPSLATREGPVMSDKRSLPAAAAALHLESAAAGAAAAPASRRPLDGAARGTPRSSPAVAAMATTWA
ncbi:hypothetical protein ACU4GD_18305 [Cupriavidus basilensis]